jgi:hypothetical protein
MEGVGGLLCYGTAFPLLHTSHSRAIRTWAYSANSKIGGNYYVQRKKLRARGELNPKPRL